jgi:SAM-dependent methyltransferase
MLPSICNICGKKLLLHYGKGGREEFKCENCNSQQRHRNLFEYFKTTNILNEKYILHFAPEKSISHFIKKSSKIYHSVDKYSNKLFISKIDINNMDSFKDNFFDIIICSHVLEHILDDVKALKEMHRVLKKDGLLFISVPIHGDRTEIWSQEKIKETHKKRKTLEYRDHYRTYGRIDVFNLFKKYFSEISLSNKIMTFDDFFICKK